MRKNAATKRIIDAWKLHQKVARFYRENLILWYDTRTMTTPCAVRAVGSGPLHNNAERVLQLEVGLGWSIRRSMRRNLWILYSFKRGEFEAKRKTSRYSTRYASTSEQRSGRAQALHRSLSQPFSRRRGGERKRRRHIITGLKVTRN